MPTPFSLHLRQFSVGLGFNNTAECAAASSYPGIRVMSIYDNTSSTPRDYIYPTYLLPWSTPSKTTVCGGGWGYFSAICWYTFRGVYEALNVPQGLISTSFGGSRLEEWMSPAALAVCPVNATAPPAPLQSGIWNVMLTPFTIGPMAVRTNLWYQGEGNVAFDAATGDPNWYGCALEAMASDWRVALPGLSTFGAFSIAACACYPGLTAAADIRQATYAPLLAATPKFAFVTAVDWANASNPGLIHPTIKQPVAARMTAQLLAIEYGAAPAAAAAVPLYAGAAQAPGGGPLAVHVALAGCGAGCVLGPAPPCPAPEPVAQCGDQFSVLVSAGAAPPAWLPASGAMAAGGAVLVLTPQGAPAGARALATAYGRGNFPLISLYAAPVPGQALPALPVLPWCFAVGAATGAVPCYAPTFPAVAAGGV